MCTSKSKLLMEVVRDEVALFVSNSIRMSLICNFIFCCNGQLFHFSLTERLMCETHQSSKILIKKKGICLLLMFGPLSLFTLFFQILLPKWNLPSTCHCVMLWGNVDMDKSGFWMSTCKISQRLGVVKFSYIHNLQGKV